MKIKTMIYLFVALIILLFPQRVKADTGVLHFYKVIDNDSLAWTGREIELLEGLTASEKALSIFVELFNDREIMFIPDGSKVLDARISNECLMLNVSADILNYAGSYDEIRLRNQIIKTALGIPGVKKVSLVIECLWDTLAEGSVIFEETKWIELDE